MTFGHSKDHRPDLKQLVWILTVSADGSVPMAYRLADGNTSDDPTHIPTWDGLVKVLGRRDFLYVADSKLCSGEAMRHIDGGGGRFVAVLPRTRGEDASYRDWIQTHQPQWAEAIRLPGDRIGDPPRVWSPSPPRCPRRRGTASSGSTPASRPPATRTPAESRIQAGAAAIDELATRLAGPKTRLKTRAAVEQAAAKALTDNGSARSIEVTVTETIEENFRQENRGRPGTDTRYRRTTRTRHTLTWTTRDDQIAYDAAGDGCFPLITNDRDMTDKDVLDAYRYQPNLERRHHLLKSVQDADPIWLRDPARIEAIFCCQFLALLLGALLERQIRTAMRDARTADIPIYPELRACEAPSAERIFAVFADLTRHELHRDGHLVQTFEADLTPLQLQILNLLGVPATAYTAN